MSWSEGNEVEVDERSEEEVRSICERVSTLAAELIDLAIELEAVLGHMQRCAIMSSFD